MNASACSSLLANPRLKHVGLRKFIFCHSSSPFVVLDNGRAKDFDFPVDYVKFFR